MKNKHLISALLMLMGFSTLSAQQVAVKDTLPQTKEEKNRNVMLNASSDNQPRQISIGLPESEAVDIFENGTPESYLYWPSYPYYSWRSSVDLSSQSLMSLSESALQYGQCKYVLDSESRKAGSEFKGLLNYTTNIYGKQVLDANVSGPIAKGWGYSVGTYQGYDPGSNHLDALDIQDKMHIYRVNINKIFADGRGEMSLTYKFARYTAMPDNYAVFYYNGEDGSVDQYEDFELGRSQYLPEENYIEYVSIKTGELVHRSLDRANRTDNHHLTYNLDYLFDNGMRLKVSSKLKSANTNIVMMKLAGIFNVDENSGYTYDNGDAYAGYVQNRYMLYFEGLERSWMTTAQLSGTSADKQHAWRIGLNEWWNRSRIYANTGVYAHEATRSPKRLLYNGEVGTNYNEGGEYYDGHENRLALFLSDDWNVSSRLWLSVGVRAEWMRQQGNAALAYTSDGQLIEASNERTYMFSVEKVGKRNRFGAYNWFNPAFTFNGRYTIINGFGLVGEYVFVKQRPNLQDYAGAYMPIDDPINVNMARGGIYWNNRWIQLTSQLTYINQTNYKAREQFTNPNDASETVILPIAYDVATLGWTTDAVLTPFKGFTFHGLLTFQSPKYKNFSFQPVFSDGPGEQYDFTDKTVVAMSKVILELDPSYQTEDWRFWLSFRYQSKQYINRTNSLYFKGRWETFGGIDYTVNKHLSLSLNVINILNQKGASGSISAADLATDVSAYQHGYLMSGTYIRPRTVELTASLKF